MSHYDYLNKHLLNFAGRVGVTSEVTNGIIVAHGDKCYGYRHEWEEGGLHFYHGAAIYLLTYLAPFSQEVRSTDAGWVDPGDWVFDNKDRFLPHLPPITD